MAGTAHDTILDLQELMARLQRIPDASLEWIILAVGIERALLSPPNTPQTMRAIEVARLAQQDPELLRRLSQLLAPTGDQKSPEPFDHPRGHVGALVVPPVPPTPAVSASAPSAPDNAQPRYVLQRETQYELKTRQTRAHELLGDAGPSERRIVVAPYGDLRLPLAVAARFVDTVRIPGVGDLARFPPAALLKTKSRRRQDGIVWDDADPMQAIRLAVGCDGSVGLRVRLHLDRPGPGGLRARGEVGIFTTIELLGAAITYAEKLSRSPERAASPGRCAFRIEHYGVSGARMMCDVPTGVDGAPPVPTDWPDRTDASAESTIRIAGNHAAGLTTADLARLLDEIAVELAVYFAVEDHVRALHPGTFVARALSSAWGEE